MLTKYVAADLLTKMLEQIGMIRMDRRASAAPKLPKNSDRRKEPSTLWYRWGKIDAYIIDVYTMKTHAS